MSIEYPYKDHEERAEILPVPDEQPFPVKQVSIYCSCVVTARKYSEYVIPPINTAADLEPNTNPHIGALILMDYIAEDGSKLPHIAIIQGYTEDGFILGDEGNYKACEHTRGRIVPFNDPRIRGFWAGEKRPTHLVSR